MCNGSTKHSTQYVLEYYASYFLYDIMPVSVDNDADVESNQDFVIASATDPASVVASSLMASLFWK